MKNLAKKGLGFTQEKRLYAWQEYGVLSPAGTTKGCVPAPGFGSVFLDADQDTACDIMMNSQQLLFHTINPLVERLGAEFFKSLPKVPGVYMMRDRAGAILYVGKAKNLRARLASYKLARPNTVSRKVLRMLRLTQSIEFEICASETEALLRENQLLREHRPPFNVVNTHPESYYFIVLKAVRSHDLASRMVHLQLTTRAVSPEDQEGWVFGVFKGRRITRRSFQALLRLLSALAAKDETFYFPTPLVRYRIPYCYSLEVPKHLVGMLRAFLNGNSRRFLDELFVRLLENQSIPKFVHHVISEDLKQVDEFYRHACRRVRALKRKHGIRRRTIAQEEIDDLLVIYALKSKSSD
ncbi:MAG: nucleotide excision repair endonuclease [Bdellovibrionota bacterium]